MKAVKSYGIAIAALVFLISGVIGVSQGPTNPPHARAEVASFAQQIIARTYLDPTTGKGFACAYLPYLHGIPEPLFSAQPKSEKTAYFTFRFTPFQAEPLQDNGDMHNALFSAGHEVRFYFNANPHGDWNNPDTFSDGQLIAIYTTRKNLLSQVGNVAFFVNSAPLTFSADFKFQGDTYNFGDLTPGGITVHILASGTVIPSPSTAPFVVQQPFSGVGIAMGYPPPRNPPSPIQNSLKGEKVDQDQDR